MKSLKIIINILLIIIILLILFVSGFLVINSYMNPNEVPNFFGWKPVIVLSNSIENVISQGDIVLVKQINNENLEIGDIIAFKKNDEIIICRISGIIKADNEKKFLIKQNNSIGKNDFSIYEDEIEGLYKYRIPRIGNFIMFSKTPIGIISCIFIPLLVFIIINILQLRKDRKLLQKVMHK